MTEPISLHEDPEPEPDGDDFYTRHDTCINAVAAPEPKPKPRIPPPPDDNEVPPF